MNIPTSLILMLVLPLGILVTIFKSVIVVQENRRGVLFRLGEFVEVVGPGLRFIVPFIDRIESVNLNDKIPGWRGLSAEQLNQKVKNVVLSQMK